MNGFRRVFHCVENRFLHAIRHRAAHSVAGAPAGGGIGDLRGRKYCLLVTYKRNGDAVPTPLWFGVAGGKVFLETEPDSPKVRRIRANPRVRVAPCDMRGKPLGAPFEGQARELPAGDHDHAERAIAANYGLERRLYERLFVGNLEVANLEITPLGGPAA